jgi:PTH1 family peptidyl-tRNA hydrolase
VSADWLVVGLGNPESEYGGTRHNVGDAVVRALAERHGATFSRNKRIRCGETLVRVGGARVALVLPESYMNTSGDPTQAAASWHDTPPDHIVVVHDELDLPLGELRVKTGGSSSHNGVRDVVRALGTREVLRLRVGIGAPPGRVSGRDHVLARFRSDEQAEVEVVLEEAADAIESLVTDGLEATQNRYHGRKGATS